MRLVFLCGSIELGRDGVGDYTRQLGQTLSKMGHTVVLVALSDPFVKIVQQQYQHGDTFTIPIVRIPITLPLQQRIDYTYTYLQTFKPDWVSLQYVPYAFHPKGIPLAWSAQFKKCAPAAQWHVMMHELWIGSNRKDPLKAKLIGFLQQQIIQTTIKSIRPTWISTSVSYYQKLLKGLGYTAKIQPVFSNIPVGNSANTQLYNHILSAVPIAREEYLLAVFFGTIHAAFDTIRNIEKVSRQAAAVGKKLILVHVGRCAGITSFFSETAKQTGCLCLELGEQPAVDIAALFTQADIGLSTYTLPFLGKSGSVAAMLNNGLPVVLLHRYNHTDNGGLPFARYVDVIDSITHFIEQPKNFMDTYGVEGTASFYEKNFNQ